MTAFTLVMFVLPLLIIGAAVVLAWTARGTSRNTGTVGGVAPPRDRQP